MVVHSRAKRSRAAEGEVYLGSAMACILYHNEGGAGSMVLCLHIFSPAKLGGFVFRRFLEEESMIEFESVGSNRSLWTLLKSAASFHSHRLLAKSTECHAPKRTAAICCFLTLIIWLLSASTPFERIFLGYSTAEAADITYVYDNLGRLIGVVDPSGSTATYSYDAVGNVVSIANHASSQVSIISFTPTSGPVGTIVTVFGSGFSATPSQDSVTFPPNKAATVATASSTTLAVSVPNGANSGSIQVTAPGGSAHSNANFTVTSSSPAPTITDFSPTHGTAGTVVQIAGTNFQTVLTSNKVAFNGFEATVTSASATNINTTVPSAATSGPISVTTPYGNATRSSNFNVP